MKASLSRRLHPGPHLPRQLDVADPEKAHRNVRHHRLGERSSLRHLPVIKLTVGSFPLELGPARPQVIIRRDSSRPLVRTHALHAFVGLCNGGHSWTLHICRDGCEHGRTEASAAERTKLCLVLRLRRFRFWLILRAGRIGSKSRFLGASAGDRIVSERGQDVSWLCVGQPRNLQPYRDSGSASSAKCIHGMNRFNS